MSSYDRTYDARQTIAAIFPSRERALAAATALLQRAGFRSLCLAAEDQPRDRLREALVQHGTSDDEANRIDAMLAAGQAVVSVNVYDYLDTATNILIDNGGMGVDASGFARGRAAANPPTSLTKE